MNYEEEFLQQYENSGFTPKQFETSNYENKISDFPEIIDPEPQVNINEKYDLLRKVNKEIKNRIYSIKINEYSLRNKANLGENMYESFHSDLIKRKGKHFHNKIKNKHGRKKSKTI